jgi:hypothetical protein
MSVVICPGIHDPQLTQSFLAGLHSSKRSQSLLSKNSSHRNVLIFPTEDYPAFSAFHILQFLRESADVPVESPLVFISFSAGVVGAIGAAWGWQLAGGQVKAFIALDGWGVPLSGNFGIHRLSHDHFTHWTSVLGRGEDSFYADPPVAHLELWRSPQIVQGWRITHPDGGKSLTRTTAAQFLTMLLERYGEG